MEEDREIAWDLAEEHLDEAAFLAGQWESALRSPRFTLAQIAAGPEERLLAQVDALVLGGARVADRLLVPALQGDDPEVVFAAAFALAEAGRVKDVLAALEAGDAGQRASIRRALGVAPRAGIAAELSAALGAAPARAKAFAADLLDVLGALRVDPGVRLDAFAQDPPTAARGLRLARVFPSRLDKAALERGLAASSPLVRAAAIETAVVGGMKAGLAACDAALDEAGPVFAAAALLAGLSGDGRHLPALLAALHDPPRARDAAFALGFTGRAAAADALLEAMRDEPLAKVAAEGFCAITGLELRREFARPAPRWKPGVPEPASEPGGPDKPLVKPDREAIARWWQAHPLDRTQRFVRGQPWSADLVLRELAEGPARRRAALALDVAVRSRGRHQLAWDALSARQRDELAAIRDDPKAFASSARTGPLVAPVRPLPAARARPVPAPATGLAVTALGLVTALANGLVQSCAASRGRLLRIVLLDGVNVFDEGSPEPVPVRGHAAADLAHTLRGVERLVHLGAAGLADLLPHTGLTNLRRVGLHLALPSGLYLSAWEAESARAHQTKGVPRPGPPANGHPPSRAVEARAALEDKLLSLLLRRAGVAAGPSRLYLHDGGGFVSALREANEAIASGAVDACIVGGIDSLVDPNVLEALGGLHLLATPARAAGILPGEGAAFVLVERAVAARRRGATVHAVLSGFAEARGPGRLVEVHEPGRALAEAIAGSLAASHTAPGFVIGSLNGDERRALDWGYAQVRLQARGVLRDAAEWHPATSFGDLGAATGPAAVCAAARAFARGYAPSPDCLVWLAGDDGSRAAFSLAAAS